MAEATPRQSSGCALISASNCETEQPKDLTIRFACYQRTDVCGSEFDQRPWADSPAAPTYDPALLRDRGEDHCDDEASNSSARGIGLAGVLFGAALVRGGESTPNPERATGPGEPRHG